MEKGFNLCRAERDPDRVNVEGYYIRYETRQVCPLGDELKDDEVIHLIARNSFADWNMSKTLEFCKVFPDTVELIGEDDL